MDQPRSPVSRGALERVLARAAELQANRGDEGERVDALTEDQIVELGQEVGLSAENIRQALAEERVRIEPLAEGGAGLAFRLFGGHRVGAQRVVKGSPDRLLATLDRWMQREEWLRVVRQRADRMVWEPRPGLLASLRRLMGGKDYALSRAGDVAATVVSVDKEFSLVRVEADLSALRRAMAGQTVGGTILGSGASAVLVVLGVMVPVAVVPAIVGLTASYATARHSQTHALQRALLTLEQMLDRLERGESQPPSLIRMIESALPPSSGAR